MAGADVAVSEATWLCPTWLCPRRHGCVRRGCIGHAFLCSHNALQGSNEPMPQCRGRSSHLCPYQCPCTLPRRQGGGWVSSMNTKHRCRIEWQDHRGGLLSALPVHWFKKTAGTITPHPPQAKVVFLFSPTFLDTTRPLQPCFRSHQCASCLLVGGQ